ncbi:hypothetical protein GBAR_LOCUS24399, partial [Geodia barretti]
YRARVDYRSPLSCGRETSPRHNRPLKVGGSRSLLSWQNAEPNPHTPFRIMATNDSAVLEKMQREE